MLERLTEGEAEKSIEQSDAYRDFHFQYGVTLGKWSHLEQSLCRTFVDLCRFKPDAAIGPALFFSGRNFTTRVDMLSAAVRTSWLGNPEKTLVRSILKRARRYSVARNAIAHGVPQHFGIVGQPPQGWRIKEHTRAWRLGGISIDQLREAANNFAELDYALFMVNDDVIRPRRPRLFRKRLKPTEWYLQLVHELPKDAFPLEEAQNEEAP